MKAKLKLWARRMALSWLRKLVDLADDRLHAAEVRLRDDLALRQGVRSPFDIETPIAGKTCTASARIPVGNRRETFQQWEARRSGVAVISKKEARRGAVSAAAFDLRFSER